MISLRPYQDRLLDQVRGAYAQNVRAVLLVSPTGSGKTVMFAEMARRVLARQERVTIAVHRDELVDQVSETLTDFGVPHGILAGGSKQFDWPVTVASVFTLARHLGRAPAPRLAIIDEAHHVTLKSTWGKVVKAWERSLVLGVTATPQRLSGEGLGAVFQTMIQGPTVGTLITAGFLCDYRLFAPGAPDTAALHLRGGDYQAAESAGLMNKPSITGNAVQHYRQIADGLPAVAFCVSVQHAEDVAAEFRAAGYRSVSIDGGTDRLLRRQTVADFRRGAINVLVSCDLISEGFDMPGIHCGIFLRPTASLGLYLQQIGRCLRTFEGKDRAILLDHAGNSRRHGLPDDPREWTLAGREAGLAAKNPVLATRTCGKCYAVVRAFTQVCPECGYHFPVTPRVVATVEGQLAEVDRDKVRHLRVAETFRAASLQELVELGKKRRYAEPERWARHVYYARQQKKQKRIELLNQ